MDIVVKEIEKKLTYDFILNKHYAKRKPSISWAYGLYIDNNLEGVLTIGKPASNSLCKGICGEKYSKQVFELNRLCVNEGLEKNILSRFVSKVLKDLKKHNLIIVSYADEGMHHHGYIYQATNFIYTGATLGRTDKYVPRGKHSRHYDKGDEFSHLRVVRSVKHRYVYICGDKKFKKEIMQCMNYKEKPYPKGNNERYVLGEEQKRLIYNKKTHEYYYD